MRRQGAFALAAIAFAWALPTLVTPHWLVSRTGTDSPPPIRVLQRTEADPLPSACDRPSTRYETAYTPGGYAVAAVVVSGLESRACAGKAVSVTLTGQGGILGEGTVTAPGDRDALRVPISGSPLAEAVTGIGITLGRRS